MRFALAKGQSTKQVGWKLVQAPGPKKSSFHKMSALELAAGVRGALIFGVFARAACGWPPPRKLGPRHPPPGPRPYERKGQQVVTYNGRYTP